MLLQTMIHALPCLSGATGEGRLPPKLCSHKLNLIFCYTQKSSELGALVDYIHQYNGQSKHTVLPRTQTLYANSHCSLQRGPRPCYAPALRGENASLDSMKARDPGIPGRWVLSRQVEFPPHRKLGRKYLGLCGIRRQKPRATRMQRCGFVVGC